MSSANPPGRDPVERHPAARDAVARMLSLGPPELVVAAAAGAAFASWNLLCAWHAPTARLASFPVLAWLLVAAGDLVARAAPAALRPALDDPATKLLVGFLGATSALCAGAWLGPLAVRGNAVLLALAVLLGRALLPGPTAAERGGRALPWAGVAVVLVCLCAATLWSWDALTGVAFSDGHVLFKSWSDLFVHASHVRMLEGAHGASSLQDLRMAGERTYFYHFASYALPALVAAATRTAPYGVVSTFMIPLGVAAVGLAAYTLVRSWWGAWPGFAAAVAVLGLPDAAQQGAANGFLSFHWLLQISPTLSAGVAALAVAWLVVFEAIRARRASWLAAGLALGASTVHFKAQLCLASAPALAVLPALAMPRLRAATRAAWLAAIVAGAAVAVAVSRRVGSVPELRLDPASTRRYLGALWSFGESPVLRRATAGLASGETPYPRVLAEGGALLLVATFGAFLVVLGVLALRLRRRLARAELLFPFLLVASYVATGLLLALDRRGIGTPEELVHRPFVWAYFGVVAWCGGALALAARRGAGRPMGPPRWWSWALLGAASLLVPARLGPGVQRGPRWGVEYVSQRLPRGLVEAALFLRTEAAPADVVQDAHGDPRLVLIGLSERREFAIDAGEFRPSAELARRLALVRRIPDVASEPELRAIAAASGLRWWLAHPGDRLAWPAELQDRPRFLSGGYRVYRLD